MEALKLDPSHIEARLAICSIYRAEEHHEALFTADLELLEVLDAAIERAERQIEAQGAQSDARLDAQRELQMYQERRADVLSELSALYLERAEREPALKTLQLLSELNSKLGRWEEYARHLQTEIELLEDATVKAEKMYHLGVVYIERLPQSEVCLLYTSDAADE